jgi:hypothetical protein
MTDGRLRARPRRRAIGLATGTVLSLAERREPPQKPPQIAIEDQRARTAFPGA